MAQFFTHLSIEAGWWVFILDLSFIISWSGKATATQTGSLEHQQGLQNSWHRVSCQGRWGGWRWACPCDDSAGGLTWRIYPWSVARGSGLIIHQRALTGSRCEATVVCCHASHHGFGIWALSCPRHSLLVWWSRAIKLKEGSGYCRGKGAWLHSLLMSTIFLQAKKAKKIPTCYLLKINHYNWLWMKESA